MSPTNTTEEQYCGNRQGTSGSSMSNSHRRREYVSDRSSNADRENATYIKNRASRDAANNGFDADACHVVNSHKDKQAGRSGGARRKGNGSKTSHKKIHRDIEKGQRRRVYSERSDEHCAICLNRMQIYAVGRCNHPVCSECSTRMRILCAQNECPICRQDMPKVRVCSHRTGLF